jgi:hypothetical protein
MHNRLTCINGLFVFELESPHPGLYNSFEIGRTPVQYDHPLTWGIGY